MSTDNDSRRSAPFWAIADQGAVSAGNFLLSIVLARHLPPSEFAVFALVFLSILACNTFHSGLVVYWMNVAGAKCDSIQVRSMLVMALLITATLTIVFAPLTAIAAFALKRSDVWGWMVTATLAWQLQETTRRSLLCQFRPLAALPGDAISYGGQVAIVLFLHISDVSSVLKIVAVTSAGAAILQILQTGLARIQAAEVWANFHVIVRLAKYSVGGNLINMVALQVPSWLLLHTGGRWQVACFQAMLSMMNAANPILFSITNFVVPLVARVSHESMRRAHAVASAASLQISAPLLIFFLAITVAPERVLALAYGHSSPYLVEAGLLRLFILAPLLQWFASCIGAYEGGMGRTKSYFLAQLFSLASLLSAGLLLIVHFGARGAVGAAILASGMRAGVTWWMSRRSDRMAHAASFVAS